MQSHISGILPVCFFPEWRKSWHKNAATPTSAYTAGLPQDPDVIWLTVSTSQIVSLFKERGITVSPYLVRRMKDVRGFKDRSFVKAMTLKEVKERNAQFEKIKNLVTECEASAVPVLSIDTKKKDMIGNFKRAGKNNVRLVSCEAFWPQGGGAR